MIEDDLKLPIALAINEGISEKVICETWGVSLKDLAVTDSDTYFKMCLVLAYNLKKSNFPLRQWRKTLEKNVKKGLKRSNVVPFPSN